ncbi:MAG: hypothetical protein ACAH12_09715 [Methylophilaceae bacterium]|uniref:hypothetical protein n=1 Tax=Methylovorus sp. MM2 TaxID=1848038 RepID=UPI0007E04C4D|nr:hypothetical protein [Methylovorus sp. MM2]OAM52703.1 hypothetical protein A7981_04425 [Methylovorus sp. MM2]
MQRVFVIQCKSTGQFLTENLYYTKSLKRAGRLYDPQEAMDTADNNISDNDWEVHSFWEVEKE